MSTVATDAKNWLLSLATHANSNLNKTTMKNTFLFGATLALGLLAPISANAADFSDAKQTWSEVRTQTSELDALIASRQLSKVHDAVLSLRDTTRELRFGWNELDAKSKQAAQQNLSKIDGLIDALHESADHNDLRGVVKSQRLLHVLLDHLAGSFPAGTLTKIGAIKATKPVTDPFCRMVVDPNTAAAKVDYAGQTYYFCAANEAVQFKQNPAPYAAIFDEVSFGKPKQFTVSVGHNQKIEPQKPATLAFAIREKGKTQLTTEFQKVHDMLLHLIIVSDDLSWFAHEHPQFAKDGRFYIKQKFPRAGRYFLYSDFTPKNGGNTVFMNEIRVGDGKNRAPQKLVADQKLSKVVDGIKVDLQLSSPLEAKKQTLLTYKLSRNGSPVTNMKPYLAAMGHMMAISEGGKQVVHTHSVHEGSDPVTGLKVTSAMATPKGPTQSFKLELPTGGLYKIWAQFDVGGRILTVPFTFQVKESKHSNHAKHLVSAKVPAKQKAVPVQHIPKGAQKVTITLPQDYKSGAATVKAGQPVAITFFLKSDAGCGNAISVPAANWNKTLKVGERATVVYTPKKSGPLKFQCSMDMYRGTILVN
jgi:YHS domain-containing protein